VVLPIPSFVLSFSYIDMDSKEEITPRDYQNRYLAYLQDTKSTFPKAPSPPLVDLPTIPITSATTPAPALINTTTTAAAHYHEEIEQQGEGPHVVLWRSSQPYNRRSMILPPPPLVADIIVSTSNDGDGNDGGGVANLLPERGGEMSDENISGDTIATTTTSGHGYGRSTADGATTILDSAAVLSKAMKRAEERLFQAFDKALLRYHSTIAAEHAAVEAWSRWGRVGGVLLASSMNEQGQVVTMPEKPS